MSLKQYFESVQQTYEFRIKSIGRLGDVEMDIIEGVLDKYRPTKISQPKKMMFQTNPLGFTGVKNAEVWFVDVTLTVPARGATLAYDLRTTFGLNGASPIIEVESDEEDAGLDNEIAIDENRTEDALLTDPDFKEAPEVDAEEHFGDAYNKRFLEYVKKVEEERIYKQKIDAPHPITEWEKQPDADADLDTTHFNDQLKDEQPKFKGAARTPSPKETK